MRSYGEDISQRKVVKKILRSLPPKFNYVFAAIEESKDLLTYTQNELMRFFISHEEKMKKFIERSLEEAFQTRVQVFRKVNEKKKVQVIILNLVEDVDVVFLVDVVVEDLIKEVEDMEVV